MKWLLSAQEMKNCDTRTMEYYGMPSMVLMERAALAVAEVVQKGDFDTTRTAIVCGVGNNGGDGIAVARLLWQNGCKVSVYAVGSVNRATEQTRQQLAIAEKYGISVCFVTEENLECVQQEIKNSTLLIDGLFGVGLSGKAEGLFGQMIQYINEAAAPVIAIDVPSGINSDNGHVEGCAVKAHTTVTFAFCKAGLVLYPGAEYAGKVLVAPIGITEDSFEKKPRLFSLDTEEVLESLPVRNAYSNKGTYGKSVLIVGSKGMSGAACLAALAACRSGCGLVRIVTPEENREILQTLVPEAVLTVYDSENPKKDQQKIMEAISWGDAVGIGSGLGRSQASEYLVKLVLQCAHKPVVIDGDGLNILAEHMDWLDHNNRLSGQHIAVTPHLGEMARLSKTSVKDMQSHLVETAQAFAQQYHVCCVLKDARTIVASDYDSAYVNLTGNHGMATGGSGDVLTGMMTSFVAQGMELEKGAIAAVHLHGCAGDAAAEKKGARGMIARDLVACISSVLAKKEHN